MASGIEQKTNHKNLESFWLSGLWHICRHRLLLLRRHGRDEFLLAGFGFVKSRDCSRGRRHLVLKLNVKHLFGSPGSPGLVVKGGDSRPRDRGFESWHRILDGYFSHYIVVKIVKTENKRQKEAGNSPFKKHLFGKSTSNYNWDNNF